MILRLISQQIKANAMYFNDELKSKTFNTVVDCINNRIQMGHQHHQVSEFHEYLDRVMVEAI